MLKGTGYGRLSHTMHIFVICRDSKGIFEHFRTNPSLTPLVYDAFCLDVRIPRIVGVSIEAMIIHFQLKGCMSVKIAGCFVTGRKRSVKPASYGKVAAPVFYTS